MTNYSFLALRSFNRSSVPVFRCPIIRRQQKPASKGKLPFKLDRIEFYFKLIHLDFSLSASSSRNYLVVEFGREREEE